MNDYDASAYGEGVADVYDVWYSGGDVAPIVDRLAGLHLRHRWGGWTEEPFTAASRNHVSVYEKPA